MAATTINSLASYVASTFPTLQSSMNIFLQQQFRNIASATASCQNVLRAGMIGVTAISGAPDTDDLPSGGSGVFKDVLGGGVYLAHNDNGTIAFVELYAQTPNTLPLTYTYATLPTAVTGMLVNITDSTTAVWGATITVGRTNKVLACYNGTNWTVVGI